MNLPLDFRFSGIHSGIKPFRRDLALILSERPCAVAGCFTANRAKAAPVIDAAARLPAAGMRALLINSGNANALTGKEGLEDVRTLHEELAATLRVDPDEVVSASTGVIGMRLPVQKMVGAFPALVDALERDDESAAWAILTTDTRIKRTSRVLRIGGREVRVSVICKGSGMIAPQLATMIAAITTDCAISPEVLQRALSDAMEPSFNSLTVDDDMSTNDAVFALANGAAENPPITAPEGEAYEIFAAALREICEEMAEAIARDGEGATKLLEVRVDGAPDEAIARDLAKSIAGSSLVKTAIFGGDPNWGRILATVGARAGSQGYDLAPEKAEVRIQGVEVYRDGPLPHDEEALAVRMRGPTVTVEVELKAGGGGARAWGCDLSYDYVKINADYSSIIVPGPDGAVAKDDRLTRYTPSFKVSLLVQALSYIQAFAGKRCVVQCNGSSATDEALLQSFSDDINLLRSVGLVPIVVFGNPSAEAKAQLVGWLNREGAHAVGVSGRDGAAIRAKRVAGGSAELTRINGNFLEMLLGQGYVPVIGPVGIDAEGHCHAVDADRVAAVVADTLGASKLIYLTDAPGFVEEDAPIPEMDVDELRERLESDRIGGPVAGKARAILHALAGRVEQVHLIDGRTPHSLIAELFTDRGVGTLITREKKVEEPKESEASS